MFHKNILFTLMLMLPLQLIAAESDIPDLQALKTAVGGKEPDSVKTTVVPGLYEVVMGSQIMYLSKDGRYAIQGDVIDLVERDNVTESRRGDLRAAAVEGLDQEKMIIFAAKGPKKHAVNIFTDIDCGYCRKMHQEIASYNDKGIEVRYLAYPRAGVGSESFNKAVSVWCSDDPKDAITKAKRGEEVPTKQCENPVKDQFELGQQLGVRGTPSLVLESGQMIPGYVPADRLVQMLDDMNKTN
jgi:thiol:disulfide interchange protein DsbC